MTRSYLRFLQVLFVLIDLLFLNIGYIIAQKVFPESQESAYYLRYSQFWLLINSFWIVVAFLGDVYATNSISYFDSFLKKSMRGYALWMFLIIVYLLLPRRIPLTVGLVLSTVLFFLIGVFLARFIYLAIREWVKRRIYLSRKILILGYNTVSKKLADRLEKQGLDLKIVGFVDDKAKVDGASRYPVFPDISNTLKISKQLRVNELYSTIMPENNAKVYNLMKDADKELIRFRLAADFSYLIDRPVQISYLDDIPILTIRKEPLEEEVNIFIKRSFDIFMSLMVLLFILWWLVPIIGLLIYLESPGPIFFAQIRSGKDNKPFRCYKFRSMTINKDANSTQATKNDKRVTKIGKILRKTSLDEFPQFWNVLIGDMSIVGPRPHMLKHTKDFASQDEDYMIRQFLKPGITGWAQVNGYRGEIRELNHIKKRVEYDLWYFEHWSFWLDIRIIFLTVYNAIRGEENAY